MREIKSLVFDKAEITEPTEGEVDLSEERILFLENLDSNLEELKYLQIAANAEPNEQKRQELREKRALLATTLESILQDMQETQASDVDESAMTRPDEKNINDLVVLSRLESKLNVLEKSEALSSAQLDSIRKKVHSLKEKKRSLIDKWEVPVIEEPSKAYTINKKAKEAAIREFLAQRKHLFSYLQSSIRNLQEKGIIRQGSISDKHFEEASKENIALAKYLVSVPIDLLKAEADALSAKFGQDDEKIKKQRMLAAKLEANIKDLQFAFEEEKKMGKPKYVEPRDILGKRRIILQSIEDQKQMKPKVSGLQIQIGKAPEIKKGKAIHLATPLKKAQIEFNIAVQDQQDKILQKKIELELKRQFMPPVSITSPLQSQGSKTSLPQLSSPAGSVTNVERDHEDIAMQEVLAFNKDMILGQKANFQQALQIAQQQLRQHLLQQKQPHHTLPEKLRLVSILTPQTPGTTRVHEYSIRPSRPVWASNQLPQKDYSHKLNMLKRKMLGAEAKGVSTRGTVFPTYQGEKMGSIAISGKGCSPNKKYGTFPLIKPNLRHN